MNKTTEIKRCFDELEARYNTLFAERSELEYELSELKAAAAHSIEQDAEIRSLNENVRRIKHDMKNHLMVIASYLNSGDIEAAKAYASQILDKLNAVYSYIETGNSLMSHILSEKLNFARSKGISVKAEIENLSFARMESLDFSAVLSNLLDNAIEACEKEASPEIFVRISRKRSYDTILVTNKISASVLAENPDLNSAKPNSESHGMGVKQIRSIAEKYDGLCGFNEENGWFCASVFIPV